MKPFSARVGEFIAYSLIALIFIVMVCLAFAMCYGLFRLVGLV